MGGIKRSASLARVIDGHDQRWSVRIFKPDYSGEVELEGGVLNPTKFREGVLESYEGNLADAAAFEYTGCPFTENGTESEKLIGAYVQIMINDEVRWVGVITSYQEQMSDDAGGGSISVDYTARGLGHALADKSIDLSLPWISSGGTFGLIAGGKYVVNSIVDGVPTVTTTQFQKPLLPLNDGDESIVEFSEDLLALQSNSMPRDLRGDVLTVIAEAAGEAKLDGLLITPNQTRGRQEIAKIEPVRYDDTEISIIFGSSEAVELNELDQMPVADSITFGATYDGVITQYIGVGGELTKASFSQLVPAWNPDLSSAVLADPKLIESNPGTYGAVGKAFLIGSEPWLYGIMPFTELPTKRKRDLAFDSNLQEKVENFRDHAVIYETRRALGDSDEDASWQETGDDYALIRYDKELASTGLIAPRTKNSHFWDEDKYAVVWFAEPQFDVVRTGTGTITETRYFKTMYMQAMRVTGRVGYDTGHKGAFPRPRFRYIHDQSWTKRLSTWVTDDPDGRIGFEYNDTGLTGIVPTAPLQVTREDRTGFMQDRLDRAVNITSKPHVDAVVELSGYTQFIRPGTRIRTIYTAQGDVRRDELDMIVKQIEFDRKKGGQSWFIDNAVIF